MQKMNTGQIKYGFLLQGFIMFLQLPMHRFKKEILPPISGLNWFFLVLFCVLAQIESSFLSSLRNISDDSTVTATEAIVEFLLVLFLFVLQFWFNTNSS